MTQQFHQGQEVEVLREHIREATYRKSSFQKLPASEQKANLKAAFAEHGIPWPNEHTPDAVPQQFYEGQDVEVYRRIVPLNDRNKEPLPPFWAWRRATVVEVPDYEGLMEEHSRAFLVRYYGAGLHACNAYNMRALRTSADGFPSELGED